MKRSKCIQLLLLVFIIPVLTIAFTTRGNHEGSSKDEWTLDKTVGNIDFYHKISTCDGKETVFLKLHNKSRTPVTVTWKEIFVVQPGEGEQKKMTSGLKKFAVPPGVSVAADCSDARQKLLITQPKQESPVHEEDIVSFSFSEIKISK